jgi:malonyl-CoA O-methyltransferase
MRPNFERAAATYDEAAVLARETGARMAERLDYVKINPQCVADIGCATGDGIRELQKRYPKALPLAIDFARPMLQAVKARAPMLQRLAGRGPRLVNADVNALPLAANSLGLVWSNLMLHWLDDPLPAFKELHRTLEVGGLLMFCVLGPDTLKELRDVAARVGVGADVALGQTAVGGALRRPVARSFLDMHDLGDMLLAAGFADPVMDMEMIRFDYRRSRQFLADQRHLGVRDDLLGDMRWQDWRRVFNAWQTEQTTAPASFEVVFGHAWKNQLQPSIGTQSIIKLYR